MDNNSDLDYQKPNKLFLSMLGLWPHQATTNKRIWFIVTIFFVITQGFLQVGGMIMAWENPDIFMESIPPVVIDIVCYIKLLNFIYNADKMKELLLWIKKDWNDYGVGDELKILNEFAANCRKQTLIYAAGVYGLMSPFVLGPLVPFVLQLLPGDEMAENETIQRPLMFHVEYLVDAQKWYYYLLVHSYFATIIYITIVVAMDTMLLLYVYHACSLFALIRYRLENLVESDDLDVDVYLAMSRDKPYRNIIECIARHKLVIEYVDTIEASNTISLFLQLGVNAACLSFTGFQAVMKLDQPEIAVRYASFMVAQVFPVFFLTYPSQCLLTESEKINNTFTRSSWYLSSIRTRQLLRVMMLKSSRPCFLTAASCFVLDMQLFAAVMRSCMSYLTMLCSLQ